MQRTFSGRGLTRICLIGGGLAFALFWGSLIADLDAEPPVVVALAVHGISILLISFGLINGQRNTESSGFQGTLGWIAAAVTVLGLLTLVPILAAGFALVGVSLLASRKRLPGLALTIGGLLFFAAYVFGTHIGDEAASEPGTGMRLVFAVALALIASGLVGIGVRPSWVPEVILPH